MIGKPYLSKNYQYHQLVIGMKSDREKEFVHGLITTLKTALIHPLIQNIPFDLQTSAFMFRNLRSGLGLVNVNFHDTRREENFLSLEINDMNSNSILKVKYSPPKNEKRRIAKSLKRLRKALWKLGCVAPTFMQETRPMGASVHYAGTLPMSKKKVSLTTSKYCQSNDFPNLYFVDGTTFPYLPAKNITLTLMANAIRIAHAVF
jgi:choline dehydrogenase-like flavoprotein